MASKKGKNILINLSSSSSSDDNGDEDGSSSDSPSFSSGDECESFDYEENDDVYEIYDDESEEDEEMNEISDDDFHKIDDDDDLSLSNRVIHFLQDKRDLQELSLKECKAYLRRHGLRVSGNKDECVRRAQEHWRIKDGKAEVLYPRSSFVVNCTGDVCKGDIVLFKQKVYGSFDKVTRKGKLLGKRTVAGRVVKESYGAAKQQHTFTVEILWSKGIKKLPPLYPLLVKGRNLYRLKTYRQLWKNEGGRRKVLDEKHRRGASARNKRAKRKIALSTNKGGKLRNISHCERPSQLSYPERGKKFGSEKGVSSSRHSAFNQNNQKHYVKQGAAKNTVNAILSKPFVRSQKLAFQDGRVTKLQPNHGAFRNRFESTLRPYHRSVPSRFAEFQGDIHPHGPMVMPAAQNSGLSHSHFNRSSDIQSPWVTHMDSRQCFSSRTAGGSWTNRLLKCSTEGCNKTGSDACAISACWRCCQGIGMACNVHR